MVKPGNGQGLIARPAVAQPLRDGLSELAAAVPTDVTTDEDIREYRRVAESRATNAEAVAEAFDLRVAAQGDDITVFRTSAPAQLRVVFLHGGGLIAGNRYDGVDVLARHAHELDIEVWTAEYPLVPEADLATMLGASVAAVVAAREDGVPVVLAGQSAGGGLAAATALACRELGIGLAGLMLICPMLDAKQTASAAQYVGDPSWSPRSNRTAWARALGASGMRAPGERDDLAGLPPVYLDVGSAEVFRDSVTAFATALWAQGVSTELHVWSGGFHGFDSVVEDATVSRESHRARREWLRRLGTGGL